MNVLKGEYTKFPSGEMYKYVFLDFLDAEGKHYGAQFENNSSAC
jgi:hypothetical protein